MTVRERTHRRNTNRAEGFDYATAGWYYVTVCTHKLQPMFGDVVDGDMVPNEFGQIAATVWDDLPARFPLVSIDAFVIMPNHIHGIIVINDDPEPLIMNEEISACVRAQFIAPLPHRRQISELPSNPTVTRQGAMNCARTNPKALGTVVRVFKAVTTNRIRRFGMSDFRWHRNYYDHIIRNKKDLDRIRTYITNNPANWPHDRANRSTPLKETPIP